MRDAGVDVCAGGGCIYQFTKPSDAVQLVRWNKELPSASAADPLGLNLRVSARLPSTPTLPFSLDRYLMKPHLGIDLRPKVTREMDLETRMWACEAAIGVFVGVNDLCKVMTVDAALRKIIDRFCQMSGLEAKPSPPDLTNVEPQQGAAYGFLTTTPDAVVEPIHSKAMPLILKS